MRPHSVVHSRVSINTINKTKTKQAKIKKHHIQHNKLKEQLNKEDEPQQHSLFVYDCLSLTLVVVRQLLILRERFSPSKMEMKNVHSLVN